MKRKLKKGSLSYTLLVALEKATSTAVSFIDIVDNPHKYLYGAYPKEINRNTLYQSMRQLKEKGYIKTQKEENKIILKITEKGKDRAILYKLLENKTWDGKWRIVIFDIPETHRKVRNALRAKLKEWQFKPLQKSVWTGKIDVIKELKEYIKKMGIDKWVEIFEANKI